MKIGYNLVGNLPIQEFSSKNENIFFRFNKKRNKIEFANYPQTDNNNHHLSPSQFWIKRELTLPFLMVDKNIDVFVSNYSFMPWRQPCKTIALIPDINTFISERQETKLADFLRVGINDSALKKANRIIVNSLTSKRYLAKRLKIDEKRITPAFFPPKAEFIAILDERKCESIKERYGIKTPYFISVGYFDRHGNILEMLEYFKIFSTSNISATLVVIEKGNQSAQDLCNKYSSPKHNIVYINISDNNEISQLINGAAVFLYTSENALFSSELCDALFCGTPIVSFKNDYSRELLESAAVLIDKKDKTGFAKAMKILIEDHTVRIKLRARAFERANNLLGVSIDRKINQIIRETHEEKYQPDEKQ